MKENEARNDCDCLPWGKGGTLLVLLAIFLIVIAVLLLAGGFALLKIMMYAAPHVPEGGAAGLLQMPRVGPDANLFLAPMLLLLFVVLALLLALLWCSCGSAGRLKEILRLLPLLRDAVAGLNAAADALFLMEHGLRDAQAPVREVSGALWHAGNNADITIPIVTAKKEHFTALNADVVIGLETRDWKPLGEVKTRLQTAGTKLNGDPDSLEAKLGQTADQCHNAAAALKAIAAALGQP